MAIEPIHTDLQKFLRFCDDFEITYVQYFVSMGVKLQIRDSKENDCYFYFTHKGKKITE